MSGFMEDDQPRALGADTIAALQAEIDAAKARGWVKDGFERWIESQGFSSAEFFAARRGEAVREVVASILSAVSNIGFPDRQPEPESDFQDIPEAMKTARRWMLWRSEPVEGKKPRKTPYYINGRPRGSKIALDSPEDAAQLGSFQDACATLRSGTYTGLGFALGQDGEGA